MLRTLFTPLAALTLGAVVVTAADEKDKAPSRPGPVIATVVRTNADCGTLTYRLRNQDGKDEEQTLEVKEGVKLLSRDRTAAKLADFARGDPILLTERDGKIAEVKEMPAWPRAGFATVTRADDEDKSLTYRLRLRDGREEERTLTITEDVRLVGRDGRAARLDDFTANDHVMVLERDGKVIEVREFAARPHLTHATVEAADADQNTLSYTLRGRDGKDEKKTLQVRDDVRLLDDDGKEMKLADLRADQAILILERDGRVMEVREAPARPQRTLATVIAADADKHVITCRVRNADGKDEEMTLDVKEGVKLFGPGSREARIEDFDRGDPILIVKRDGEATEVRELPAMPRQGFATVEAVDAGDKTMICTLRGRDGKEEQRTLDIVEGVKLWDRGGDEAKLSDFDAGDHVLIVERDGKLVGVREFPARPHVVAAMMVRADADGNVLTVRVRGRDGKDDQRDLNVKEGVRLVGDDGKEAKFDDFDADDHVLIFERDGRVMEVRMLKERRPE